MEVNNMLNKKKITGKYPDTIAAKPDSGVQIPVPQMMVDVIVAEYGDELNLITSIAGQYLKLGFDMSRVAGASATTSDLQKVLDNGSHTLIEHHEAQIAKVAELTNDLDKLINGIL